MSIEILIRHATEPELRVIADILHRANARPAVVVTVKGTPARRYVVSQSDEHLFDDFDLATQGADGYGMGFWFSCQWLRSLGKVDEMGRTLGSREVGKVARIDRARVWGS